MEQNSCSKQTKSVLQDYNLHLVLPFSLKAQNSRRHQNYERDGHWNQRERLKYSVFLGFFHELLEDPIKKKKVRIYEMMADMIVTRNANQCRSHHQKMQKYRKTIPQVITSVSEKYEPTLFIQLTRKYLVLIKQLLENSEKYRRNGSPAAYKRQCKKQTPVQEPSLSANQQNDEPVFKGVKVAEDDGSEDSQPLFVQRGPVIKKEVRKTADSYQDQANNQLEEDDVPRMRFDSLSENEEQIVQPQPVPTLPQENPIHQANQSYQQPVAVQGRGEMVQIEGFYIDPTSRYQYQRQVEALELQKQVRTQYAQQLFNQWSNEVQRIKQCDDTIKIYNQILIGSSQQNLQ